MEHGSKLNNVTFSKLAHTALFGAGVVVLLLFSSCARHVVKDGPPNFYVDETKVPDAKPKVEPLSHLGNMHSYKVNGTRYYVLSNCKNYEERGIASWYGTKFHKHHTSSGDRYNMLGMTAAHRTLPLPTYVQVTNLKNGKHVIVKVNDRGPFEKNRLIDLSYVAAKKLGMLGHGTAFVDVKAIDPTEQSKHIAEQDAPRKTEDIYLQVGVFQNEGNANKLQQRLAHICEEPVHIAVNDHAPHKLYQVKIGPIKNVATADDISQRLKGYGFDKTITIR